MVEANKRRIYTEEHLRKMSESNKGEKGFWYGKSIPIETRQKISNTLKGKHLSKEHKRKISISMKGELLRC